MNKYRNIKTVVNGITFSSRKEAKRYSELLLLESAREITGLVLQPKFVFEQNDVKICSYVADFGYIDRGSPVIEDCKGFKTPVYRLKKKLMKAFYMIEILET